MKLKINGKWHELQLEPSVAASLLVKLKVPTERTALEVNGDIVMAADYHTVELKDGDSVEIVTFVGGG